MTRGSTLLHLSARIAKWVTECLGSKALFDPKERALRLIEEAIEIGQVEGLTEDDVIRVAKYVMGRPIGERTNEAGGTLVCVLAYCYAVGLDPYETCEREVSRIESADFDKIRTKHAAKVHAGVAR